MEIMGDLKKHHLGAPNTKISGEIPKNGGKYYWICLANEIVEAIAERNVCTKFKENRPKLAICIVQSIYYIYIYILHSDKRRTTVLYKPKLEVSSSTSDRSQTFTGLHFEQCSRTHL